MRLKLRTSLLVLCLGAAASTPATAAVFASAQLSNFTLTLIDPNLGDGVAPSVSVSDANSFSRIINSVLFNGLASDSRDVRGLSAFGALSTNVAVATLSSLAQVIGGSGAAPWEGALLHAEGRLANIPGNGEAGPLRTFTASASGIETQPINAYFLLGPYTAITMTALAEVAVSKDFAAPVGSFVGEAVIGQAGITLTKGHSTNGQSVQQRLALTDIGQVLTRSFTVTAEIYNLTANAVAVDFRAVAGVDGISQIAAVPEPETWALWAAGLAVLGALYRRRALSRPV